MDIWTPVGTFSLASSVGSSLGIIRSSSLSSDEMCPGLAWTVVLQSHDGGSRCEIICHVCRAVSLINMSNGGIFRIACSPRVGVDLMTEVIMIIASHWTEPSLILFVWSMYGLAQTIAP